METKNGIGEVSETKLSLEKEEGFFLKCLNICELLGFFSISKSLIKFMLTGNKLIEFLKTSLFCQ